MRHKTLVKCISCEKEWMKDTFDIKKWQGKCKSCAKLCNTIGSGNKGKPKSLLHRQRISSASIGHIKSEEHKKKISISKTGICTMSDERKAKQSQAMKGSLNPFYIDGRTPLNERIRHSLEYKNWRKAVFKRDNYTCQICNKYGGDMNADHIKPFAYFPELRLSLDNGRTLCIDCHRQTETFGYKGYKNNSIIVNNNNIIKI